MIAAGAGLVSAGGLIGAAFVKSPEQQRAETTAPARTVLTSDVEKRVLASTLVTRGQVGTARQVEVTPAVVQGASISVVTGRFASVGATVKSGDVVLSVSGRPIIALEGAIMPYRDMRPADNGPDIEQLQAALRSLGLYGGGDAKGAFGAATKSAVRKLYAKAGYAVPETGGFGGKGDVAALRAAADAVEAAERLVASLQAKMAANPSTPPPSGEPSLPQQLETAQKNLARAKEDQVTLVASTGPMVPVAEVTFLPSFPSTVVKIGAAIGQQVVAPLIVFATGALEVTTRLSPDEASTLREGMRVELRSEVLGAQSAGVISSISPVTTPIEQGRVGVPYRLATVNPTETLPSEWNGLDVRLTITAAQTAQEVLVVPLSAVSGGADGKTIVTVLSGDGGQKAVEVQAGISGDGFVEVTPIAGSLKPGDKVVIGR